MLDGRDVEREGFPRLAAFSEAVWSPTAVRDYPASPRASART
jgi:hypothetical protein